MKRSWRSCCAGVVLGVIAPCLAAQSPPQTLPPITQMPQVVTLDLATAKRVALERQPSIAAARQSLAAAHARKTAVDNIRVPTFLQRDLPVRRKQAALGPVAGQAGVLLAEINTTYAVQYTYVTYLYARTQQKYADDTLQGLQELERQLINNIQKEKAEDDPRFIAADLDRAKAMIRLARSRREEASLGSQRALSALREAMGVGADCPLMLANDRLLQVDPDIDCDEVVKLALDHRPEIVQASIAHQVHELEVAAQGSRINALSVRTFASGSDIHAQPLPAGSYEGDYKPGAVGPEMPISINGRQCDRVIQATIYYERSASMVEKVKRLITLDVQQAYLRYREARGRLAELGAGVVHAANSAKGFRAAMKTENRRDSRMRAESFLNAALIGSQMRVQENEARYQLLLALIGLERATGGTFCAGLDHAPQIADRPPDVPEEAKDDPNTKDKRDRQ